MVVVSAGLGDIVKESFNLLTEEMPLKWDKVDIDSFNMQFISNFATFDEDGLMS